MSLHLDTRQRAMLQEMGVHVWWPQPAQALADTATPVPASAPPVPSTAPPAARPAPSRATLVAPVAPAAPVAPVAPVAPAVPAAGTPLALVLQAPQHLYPDADAPATPAEAGAGAGAGWLIVAEGLAGADPLAGEAGRLLDNMLRALRLHRHPRVFLCALLPLAADGPPAVPCTDALAQAVAAVQPAVVLVMGRVAARAALGRSEPLGHLRAQPHAVAGVPTVVTYDAPYLLRAPTAKAGAWADLCHALALAWGQAQSADQSWD